MELIWNIWIGNQDYNALPFFIYWMVNSRLHLWIWCQYSNIQKNFSHKQLIYLWTPSSLDRIMTKLGPTSNFTVFINKWTPQRHVSISAGGKAWNIKLKALDEFEVKLVKPSIKTNSQMYFIVLHHLNIRSVYFSLNHIKNCSI